MAGTCQFSFGQASGAAAWTYDGSSLVVTPQGSGPLTFAVKEISGISGDDYTVKVRVRGGAGTGADAAAGPESAELTLSMLGHDGPTLSEALRRDWLQARTAVLRLGGSGDGWSVQGQVAGLTGETPVSGSSQAVAGPSEPFRALLYEDVLVVGREANDLEPVFLALVDQVSFDEATYAVTLDEWPGRRLVFSKMAKQTDEFVKRLGENRALLAKEASATLAAGVPGVPVAGRGVLAGAWLPGRLMELSRMDGACPGFESGFRGGWLAGALRREEGAYLLEWASPEHTWLGGTRENGDSVGEVGRPSDKAAAQRPLWMLAGKGGTWFLEPLSLEDHATYRFKGGDEVPALISRLLCAPQFSKEALYSPLVDLTGDNADLAIPAGSLDFLAQLRARFQGRVIHQSVESWRKEVDGVR
jgi:hypothetical protein